MTEGLFDPERFILAQEPVIEQVRQELRAGRKRSHWMWFVFPQISGLGHSAMARHYAIASREAALAYLRHSVLGPRLVECSEVVNGLQGRTIHDIFGSPDNLKFHSCMTLFASLGETTPAFNFALEKYFGGEPDRLTMQRLSGEPGNHLSFNVQQR